MTLIVIYNEELYLWVDTISLADGLATVKAILVSLQNGKVTLADINNIKVVQNKDTETPTTCD